MNNLFFCFWKLFTSTYSDNWQAVTLHQSFLQRHSVSLDFCAKALRIRARERFTWTDRDFSLLTLLTLCGNNPIKSVRRLLGLPVKYWNWNISGSFMWPSDPTHTPPGGGWKCMLTVCYICVVAPYDRTHWSHCMVPTHGHSAYMYRTPFQVPLTQSSPV